MRTRLASEDGMSLIELLVGALLASMLLAGLGAFLVSSMRTGAFAQGQSYTINDVRNVLQQIEVEVRGAEDLEWCAPAGSCIQVTTESRRAPHDLRTSRYVHVGGQLQRSEFTDGAWGTPETVIERVENTASQPVFDCDIESTLLRVVIDLHIEPTPASDPLFNVQTSIRPRNFAAVASCP